MASAGRLDLNTHQAIAKIEITPKGSSQVVRRQTSTHTFPPCPPRTFISLPLPRGLSRRRGVQKTTSSSKSFLMTMPEGKPPSDFYQAFYLIFPREFLTGFHKRKVARAEVARAKAKAKEKQERLEARRDVR